MVAVPPHLQVLPSQSDITDRIVVDQQVTRVDNLDLAVDGVADPQVGFAGRAEDDVLRPRRRGTGRDEPKHRVSAAVYRSRAAPAEPLARPGSSPRRSDAVDPRPQRPGATRGPRRTPRILGRPRRIRPTLRTVHGRPVTVAEHVSPDVLAESVRAAGRTERKRRGGITVVGDESRERVGGPADPTVSNIVSKRSLSTTRSSMSSVAARVRRVRSTMTVPAVPQDVLERVAQRRVHPQGGEHGRRGLAQPLHRQ